MALRLHVFLFLLALVAPGGTHTIADLADATLESLRLAFPHYHHCDANAYPMVIDQELNSMKGVYADNAAALNPLKLDADNNGMLNKVMRSHLSPFMNQCAASLHLMKELHDHPDQPVFWAMSGRSFRDESDHTHLSEFNQFQLSMMWSPQHHSNDNMMKDWLDQEIVHKLADAKFETIKGYLLEKEGPLDEVIDGQALMVNGIEVATMGELSSKACDFLGCPSGYKAASIAFGVERMLMAKQSASDIHQLWLQRPEATTPVIRRPQPSPWPASTWPSSTKKPLV